MKTHEKDLNSDGLLNRRDFFKRAAILGAVAAGGASLLAACDNKGGAAGAGGEAAKAPAAKAGGAEALNCEGTDGLTPDQVAMRTNMNYVDKTPKADQDCANCLHFEPASGDGCGGCKVVPGTIHPDGWCTIWAAKV